MNSKTLLSLLGCAVLGVALATTYSYGRNMRATLDQVESSANEQAAGAFCRELGLAPDSAPSTRCLNGLREMRARDRSRWEADAVGFL